jgi:FkbM family methyltransferase
MIKTLVKSFIERLPNVLFLLVVNFIFRIKGLSIRASFEGDNLLVSDGEIELNLVHKKRIFLYFNGIKSRLRKLTDNYMLNFEKLKHDVDYFFDIGCNIGELGILAKSHDITYHGFEPSFNEYKCAIKNLNSYGKINNIGLWYEKTTLQFYQSSAMADSSFIEPKFYNDIISMNVDTLDNFKTSGRIFLKVEAEGAEIEVLRGAVEFLKDVSIVAVDTGFERGVNEESTTVEVINFLIDQNFRLVDFTPGRLILLFTKNVN